MKFSIVTISYNQARFLEEAMLSVLNQKGVDVEYIVVDPGSTDGSREIIERYRDRIARVIFEADHGPADGLNKGFAVATGEIYGFLNADDLLLAGVLAKVAQHFEANARLDVVSGHSIIIDGAGRTLRICYSDRFSLLGFAYGAVVLMQPSTFFRRGAFKKIGGFNPASRSAWDGELFVNMALAGARFALMPAFLSAYRVHAESITGSGKLDEQIKCDQRRLFRKIMNRPWMAKDAKLIGACRILKHLREPRNLYQRLAHGPIYRRARSDT